MPSTQQIQSCSKPAASSSGVPSQRNIAPKASRRLHTSCRQKHHRHISFIYAYKAYMHILAHICICSQERQSQQGSSLLLLAVASCISRGQNEDSWHPEKQRLQRWSVYASRTRAAPRPPPACWEVCLSPRHVWFPDGIF